MIQSRYLNIFDPSVILDRNEFASAIQYTWYIKNNKTINITEYKVLLSESGFYTSVFKEYVLLHIF